MEAEYLQGDYSVTLPYRTFTALFKAGKINPDYIEQIAIIIGIEKPGPDDDIELPIACFPTSIWCRWTSHRTTYYGSASHE